MANQDSRLNPDQRRPSFSQGKVHNPSGEGVAAFTAKKNKASPAGTLPAARPAADHATRKIEEGSSRRNITRKKTDPAVTGRFDSRNKKRGGAGKGKWRDPLDGSDQAAAAHDELDEDDPLYVADEDAAPSSYVLSSGHGAEAQRREGGVPTACDGDRGRAVYGPLLTLPEFKLRVADAVREYFDASDADEVVRCIDEMRCREYHPEVVKRAVGLALDAGPRERELVSRLLACLHPNPLTDEEMEAGFEVLLDSIDDLVIDIPDAKVSESPRRGSVLRKCRPVTPNEPNQSQGRSRVGYGFSFGEK